MTALDAADLRDELRSVARSMLTKLPSDDRRAWGAMADAGWFGLDVPGALGGSDATFAEVAVVLEEMGRAALPTAYLGTAVLGIGLLGLLEPGAERDELLRGAAAGDVRLAVAVASDVAGGASPVEQFRLERSTAGAQLVGHAPFVVGGGAADRILVPVRDADGVPMVLALEPTAAVRGLHVETRPLVDATRPVARVAADRLDLGDVATWRFAGDPDASLRRLLDRAAVAVACDSLGVSEAMLDATVSYATVRHQFGRPIGSFQAVKHACADMLVAVSLARELLWAAVRNVADGDGDVEAAKAVSMAKSYVCGAAVDVVGKALQLHGGIGYTWESDVHVHLKRALLNRALFGTTAAHRRRIARGYHVESAGDDVAPGATLP